MDRSARRRAGLASHGRTGRRRPSAPVARRRESRLGERPDPGGGARRGGRGRPDRAADPLGRPPHAGARLARRPDRRRGQLPRPALRPLDLGPHRPARRRAGGAAALRAGGRPRPARRPHAAADRLGQPRPRPLEALPGRRHGPAVARRPPPARRSRGPARLPDAGRRPDRLPVRPRGTGNLYSVAYDGRRPAPPHGPRRTSTPARPPPTAPGSCTPTPEASGCCRAWTPSPNPWRSAWAGPDRGRQHYWAGSRPDDLACDTTGRASLVEVAGTVHWVTHEDGPSRALSARGRARLPIVLGRMERADDADDDDLGKRVNGPAAWVTDAPGEDAIELGVPGRSPARSRPASWAGSRPWRPPPTAR